MPRTRVLMDELDRKVIAILQEDGRASNAHIARRVGVSEGTVRRRLKRLVQEGYIRVLALPQPQKLGYETEAIIGVQVDPDKLDEVGERLAQLKEVQWAAVTTGAFDVILWATVPSAEDLGTLLRAKIGSVPGVRRTETFVALSVKKRSAPLPVS
ncbi:Leucine-responsive regulatory protein [bacterium HR23]|uniref:Lrp/AsnC family transcriptional regulator n=1 Tax=uncultured prokaryote TaxID=198431 RepID=H5SLE6_9ZZZZ|nr:Lrp/AsnC family transcriptional regulator [uncultured prokaryote]GBD11011.1 Leucine-responsive regulatory protein [bacterium HR23]